ncbi:lactate racemase domain-containing protein [Salsuginibacillus kocurii]|uniref:lactate racemase domain-containing protein n=1 Tax=Salsuginibacillus kocurii TaxID=427078 RepID=UPI00036855AD|nr:lactate racemase domain-containing protein [Salsuginibacillus kocurii]
MELIEIYQNFPEEALPDKKAAIREEVKKQLEQNQLPAGSEIAITAGSRGIHAIAELLKETVQTVQGAGYKPFLVPAMGSHGGATAEGQLEVLDHLGVTENTMGAEIRSSMEVELIGYTENGVPAYMDKHAFQAEGIIVVNRVKAHTAFRGKVESGLSKMVTIGLGKIRGATFVHSHGSLKMAENIIDVCKTCLKKAPPLMGIGIVENAFDKTAQIKAVSRDHWFEEEAELLNASKEMMPRLPIDTMDILVVEEMGKNYSGTGMDPNIIGRWRIDGVPEPPLPEITRIVTLDLSPESFGNAQGVGLGDFITQRLADQMDRHVTYTNALTSTYLRRAMLPFIYETEKEAIETAIRSLGPEENQSTLKLIQIPNTLHLDRLLVSPAVIEEMEEEGVTYTIGERKSLTFTSNGEVETRLLQTAH